MKKILVREMRSADRSADQSADHYIDQSHSWNNQLIDQLIIMSTNQVHSTNQLIDQLINQLIITLTNHIHETISWSLCWPITFMKRSADQWADQTPLIISYLHTSRYINICDIFYTWTENLYLYLWIWFPFTRFISSKWWIYHIGSLFSLSATNLLTSLK